MVPRRVSPIADIRRGSAEVSSGAFQVSTILSLPSALDGIVPMLEEAVSEL